MPAGFDAGSTGNRLDANGVGDQAVAACTDASSGSGTLGTGNTWTPQNSSDSGVDRPDGICPRLPV
jgi:hypothetical protein